MSLLAWNCRGAAKKRFLGTLTSMIRKHRIDLTAIFEPRISGAKAQKIIKRTGYNNCIVEEAQGFMGGIWVLWNKEFCNVTILEKNMQMVHLKVCFFDNVAFLCTFIYANPREEVRRSLWQDLRRIADSMNEPWLITDDFNEIASPFEKRGGAPVDLYKCNRFASLLTDLKMIDLNSSGSRFTWRGPRFLNMDRVFKQLDRACSNDLWRVTFEEGHEHILFNQFLKDNWHVHGNIADCLKVLTPGIKEWNEKVFGNIKHRKNKLMRRLEGIQRAISEHNKDYLEKVECKIKAELEEVLDQEELLWYEKSRTQWINQGDRNTRYYHTKTIVRRKRGRIVELKDDNGSWIRDEEGLVKMTRDFYINLFKDESCHREWINTRWPIVPEEVMDKLRVSVTKEEVKKAFFTMKGSKAPGEDGYIAAFYQKNWNLVGDQVWNAFLAYLENPQTIADINGTIITLIPKVNKPTLVSQFRPISLCNVIYKGMSKVIVGRLKEVMEALVSDNQTSFVPNRNLQNNIIAAKEIVHSMTKFKGKMGTMAIKIDLEKAYDKLNWSFIRKVISEIQLPSWMVEFIMASITTNSFKVLVNGGLSETIIPERGIRQGDPLSPYIFVLCVEKLSHLIAQRVGSGVWKPIRVCRVGPAVSHLMFADDIVLFSEASVQQMQIIMECLDLFCRMSGQSISVHKSTIYFSSNTSDATANAIYALSGFKRVSSIGKYLGSFIRQGRNLKSNYADLMDRVRKKLDGWKHQSLSFAGRVTLAKSVIGAIPSFHMQNGLLPTSVCDEIEQLQRNFIWGNNKAHLVAWDTMYKPKEMGGLGIIRLRTQNEAYIHKLAWKILTDKEELWVKILRAKYGRGKDLRREISSKPYDSKLWRDLSKCWNSFLVGLRWEVGDGETIKFWADNWLNLDDNLCNLAPNHIPDLELHRTIAEIFQHGTWDVRYLKQFLNDELISKVFCVPVALEDNTEDKNVPWKKIWDWKGPERIKTMWLAILNKLPVRSRTCKWNGGPNFCINCPNSEETLIHVLRDCSQAKRLWIDWFGRRVPNDFFTLDLQPWLIKNVSKGWNYQIHVDWRDVFYATCWNLWNWRNHHIHDDSFRRPSNDKRVISDFIAHLIEARDGASSLSRQHASCGGLARDHNGAFLGGFSFRLGFCNPLDAELWGILKGLELAWGTGARRVELECDSEISLSTIQEGSNNHRNSQVVSRYRVFPLKMDIVLKYEPYNVMHAVMEESAQGFRMIPASKNAIHSLKKFKVMKQDEYCTIYLEEFDVSGDNEGIAVSAMTCDHVFHQQCIMQ
ncbi:uncharacterized protein LOC133288718 [Gastrolobium bilobum]|uniref:uncharacterized protein LOC133288718 n=1 Tax=Gastrolobium bilobum TaxID=150636 RepID=UPI002AB2D4A5|nr:uncharacterized protein LOC133288718 [Gastrolobium bilobum]